MIRRYCDFCGKEINRYFDGFERDSETQFYELVKKHFNDTEDYTVAICNECMHKVVGEFGG